MRPDFDLDDETLRRTRSVKWTFGGPEVLPAWVAELDVAVCPPVAAALHRAIDDGAIGYPAIDRDSTLREATTGFLADRFGWDVDPALVISTGDVMAGIMLTLWTLCEPGPVVVPVPSYPPFLAAVPLTGRELVPVPMLEPGEGRALGDGSAPGAGPVPGNGLLPGDGSAPGAGPVPGAGAARKDGDERTGWRMDLDRIDAALAAGARTVLLANPHNPTGRCFSRTELEGLRDVVLRHGARVISDEIHAPLVLPGAVHTPYAALDGTADHVTTLVAASKAWNLPGLKCAQLIAGSARDAQILTSVPPVANHGTSPLGVIASVAAYTEGRDWLDGLTVELTARRTQLDDLITTLLPTVRWQPSEGTYLAWLDARGTGVDDPATEALARARVMVNRGSTFGDGPDGLDRYRGFVRVNFGTSAERLDRVMKSLADAWVSP